jgi:hypothetical protein
MGEKRLKRYLSGIFSAYSKRINKRTRKRVVNSGTFIFFIKIDRMSPGNYLNKDKLSSIFAEFRVFSLKNCI